VYEIRLVLSRVVECSQASNLNLAVYYFYWLLLLICTANSCCLLIKATVKDSDIFGNAIQCFTNYIEESGKKAKLNHRGKKVHIFENHNRRVVKDPKVSLDGLLYYK